MVGGSPGDGGGGTTTESRRGGRGGEREEQALKRESSREASGRGYKEEEEEEEGLKLKRVVRIDDLQINKTSRFPETLAAKQRGIQSIKNSMK